MAEPNGLDLNGGSGPQRIPNFDLLEQIGQGGFGRVWLARERVTGLERAVKLIPKSAAERTAREIEGVRLYQRAALEHAALIQILTVGEEDGCYFCVMEIADRANDASQPFLPVTLRHLLRSTGRHSALESMEIVARIAAGVCRLREAELAHNDLKPENVLIVKGRAKVCDPGLISSSKVSVEAGTRAYMAPEGQADDSYALGKILYELISGLPAAEFPRVPTEIARRPTTDLRAGIQIFNRACHPEPSRRFRSPAELEAALRTAIKRTQAGRFRGRMGMLVGSLLLLILAGWVWSEWRAPNWDIEVAAPDGKPYTHMAITDVVIEPNNLRCNEEYEVRFRYRILTGGGHTIFAGLAVGNHYVATFYRGKPGPSGWSDVVSVRMQAPATVLRQSICAVVAHVSDEDEMRDTVRRGVAEPKWLGSIQVREP